MEAQRSLFFRFIYHGKAMQIGLWLVWFLGFCFICISLYATQMLLPIPFKNQMKESSGFRSGFVDSSNPTITIFTAPSPFDGLAGDRQVTAIRSWLGLSENVNVVLFSQDSSVISFADEFGSRVSVEPNIDFTFLGTPFFHSMVARSLASSSDVSVLIDSDTILLPNFISTLEYAYKLDEDWLLFASSQTISHFPFHLDPSGKHWIDDDGKRIGIHKLQEFLARKSHCKPCGDRMLMAWNNGDLPLHYGVLPPFLYGKGLHNRWILTEALSSDFRVVLDASWTISNFYLNFLDQENYQSIENFNISNFEMRSWEFLGNSHLGKLYGLISMREANYSNLFRFTECGRNYIFINTMENIVYPLGYKRALSLRKKGISLSSEEEIRDCVNVVKSLECIQGCSVKDQLKLLTPISLPLSLESLLSMRANQNKTIVLAVAGYSYKDMLMSWVCRLRQLHLENFLVCALDHEIYSFAVLQGLPVFKYATPPTNISFDNCHFGTECFQKVTKVKSRMVLQILKLGYNVLLSDVDVYWFKNPLSFLRSFGPAVLVAQSDEYNITGPINLPRRLNSGFYYAHSDGITIAALEKVVKHAINSNLSEQPSFYDTLCGEGGSHRLGNNGCLESKTNLTVYFLNRDLFPNGAYQGLWEEINVREACMNKGCYILHNNWISGRRKKLERQVLSGLWEYDISARMCQHSWSSTKDILIVGSTEMCSCFGSRSVTDSESRRQEELYSHLKNTTVRIVHAGGRIELHKNAIPASELIRRYRGMCIARPDIFKRPHDSILSTDDMLLPGNKYIIIRSTTVEKLKRRHLSKWNLYQQGDSDEPILDIKDVKDIGDTHSEGSFCSAKDFYISKDSWSNSFLRKHVKEKKPFIPPNQRPRMWKEPDWEPSLTSIQELSP